MSRPTSLLPELRRGSFVQSTRCFRTPDMHTRRRKQMPGWKRAMDLTVASFGLILLSPVLLLIAALIKIVSPGPALLKQERVGFRGRTFTLWKFRTMKPGSNAGIHEGHLKSLITSDAPMIKLDS